MDPRAEEVLRFWFDETPEEDHFEGGEAFDARCRDRLGALHDQATAGALDDWAAEPRAALALVILLDQLSRNLDRNLPGAFAHDAKALEIAAAVIERGHDEALAEPERKFLYMPFQHIEDEAGQERGLILFARMQDEKSLIYMAEHYRIIRRFGRFPHRNQVLGRTSTAEEIEFLTQPGSSF